MWSWSGLESKYFLPYIDVFSIASTSVTLIDNIGNISNSLLWTRKCCYSLKSELFCKNTNIYSVKVLQIMINCVCVKSAYFSLNSLIYIYIKRWCSIQKWRHALLYRILCTLRVSIPVDYKVTKEEGTHRVQSTWVKQKSVNAFTVYLFFLQIAKYYGYYE